MKIAIVLRFPVLEGILKSEPQLSTNERTVRVGRMLQSQANKGISRIVMFANLSHTECSSHAHPCRAERVNLGPKQQKQLFDRRTSGEMLCLATTSPMLGGDSNSQRNDNFGFAESAMNFRCFGSGHKLYVPWLLDFCGAEGAAA